MKDIFKWIIYIGVASLLYTPFIVSSGMFFPYIVGKAYFFRIVVEIIFFTWVILAAMDKDYRPKKTGIFISFSIFTILILISNLLGVNVESSLWSNYERMEGWVTIVHLLALFVVTSSVLDRKAWIKIFNIAIIFSLFMVLKVFGEVIEFGLSRRVITTLGNSTYVGIYALMNSFLALFLINEHIVRNELSKVVNVIKKPAVIIYILAFILNSWVIFQTGTRGSMLGWLGGLLLSALIAVFLDKGNKKLKKISVYSIGAIAMFIAIIFFAKDTTLIQETESLKRITTISVSEGTAKARILNWQMAIEGIKEKPLLGWGQSNFNYVFDKYYLPEHHGNEVWFDRTHNIIFDWLIAGGVVGLLGYLSIWFFLILAIFKLKDLSVVSKSLLIGLLAGYFFHNLFVFDQIVSYIYFVLILAFVNSFSDKRFKVMEIDIPDWLKYTKIILAAILLPITIYAVNIPSIESNKELVSALRLTKQNSDGTTSYYYNNGIEGNIEMFKRALERNTFGNSEIRERALLLNSKIHRITNIDATQQALYIEMAATEVQKQIEKDPLNSKYPYILGVFYANLGQFNIAEEYLLKAIELSPNKQTIRYPLIQVYSTYGQGEKAVALAKETYELDVSKNDVWSWYVSILTRHNPEMVGEVVNESIDMGMIDRVERLLVSNLDNNPDDYQSHISLAAFYFKIGEVERSLIFLEEIKETFPELRYQIDVLIKKIENGENPLS